MRAWLENLEPREMNALILCLLVLLAFFIYIQVWAPFHDHIHKLEQRVGTQSETAEFMRQAAKELANAKNRRGAVQVDTSRSLLAVVDSSAKQFHLGSAIKRVEPDGEDGVRVWMEAATFDDLVRWLAMVKKRYAVSAESLNIDAGSGPGLVNSRLLLTR